jgi:MFS family permease
LKSKQLFFLFFCNFVTWFVGMGLLPVLPLYASQFGASPTMVGFYLAFTYLSITVGTILAGRLAGKVGAKSVFIGGGIIGIPTLGMLWITWEFQVSP